MTPNVISNLWMWIQSSDLQYQLSGIKDNLADKGSFAVQDDVAHDTHLPLYSISQFSQSNGK